MRQISIKALGKRLSIEMQDLPFEVTRYGRVVGFMVAKGTDFIYNGTDKIRDIESKGTDSGTKQDKNTQKGTDKLNTAKQQLSKIVDKKKKVTTSKANIHTDRGFFNPQPKA